ncbi:MAG: 4Fe-4S binding protein [Chloroflexi bacterium]|nr:4Fe-4S binding protein [Chloroflexota bacterium]
MSTNLLQNRSLRRFLTSGLYPAVFQAVTAAVFVVIMFQLVLGPAAAHSNFGTAMTWVLWWPLIPIIFVVLGRFWCAICPFGTLSDLVQKYVGNNRPVPEFLKKYGIWIIDALFILITWADHVWGIVESPWGSGMLLLGLTTGVVVSGAFWQRRTWCRYLCFLGGLAGNYARAGMIALRADPAVCAKCKSRAVCFNGNEKGPGCPMFEFPRLMESNASCNLCAACVKTCPNDAIQITLRPPTKELWFVRKPKFEEAFLAIVIMGIVFVQNVTMLEVWNSLLQQLQQITRTDNYAVNFTITFIIAMGLPVTLFGLAALVARRFNDESVVVNLTKFGYAIIPLDIAGHIAHNLYHLLAEGKAVGFTALEMFGQQVDTASAALVPIPAIQVMQYGLIVLGALASLYAVYAISKNHYGQRRQRGALISYAALVAVLFGINVWLFTLPMAMRM